MEGKKQSQPKFDEMQQDNNNISCASTRQTMRGSTQVWAGARRAKERTSDREPLTARQGWLGTETGTKSLHLLQVKRDEGHSDHEKVKQVERTPTEWPLVEDEAVSIHLKQLDHTTELDDTFCGGVQPQTKCPRRQWQTTEEREREQKPEHRIRSVRLHINVYFAFVTRVAFTATLKNGKRQSYF